MKSERSERIVFFVIFLPKKVSIYIIIYIIFNKRAIASVYYMYIIYVSVLLLSSLLKRSKL